MENINDTAGLWSHRAYQSGTQIVTSENPHLPHYYVYADERTKVCRELAAWLNFSEVPKWAKTLKRENETVCAGSKGINISAIGPMVLSPDDNGRLHWTEDKSTHKLRVALIDALLTPQEAPNE